MPNLTIYFQHTTKVLVREILQESKRNSYRILKDKVSIFPCSIILNEENPNTSQKMKRKK